jgi:DNA-binding transcriptional ArsR family regulator
MVRESGSVRGRKGRLFGAAAVALVAALLLDVAVVAAGAGQAEPDVSTFGVPAPTDGDRFTYSMTLTGDWSVRQNDTLRLGVETPAYEFAWRGTEPVRLADGFIHDAARLDVTGLTYWPMASLPGDEKSPRRSWWVQNETAWYGPSGAVAREGVAEMMYQSGSARIGLVLLPTVVHYDQSYTARATRFDGVGPCLAQNHLQGARIDLDAKVALFPPCRLGNVLSLAPDPKLDQFVPGWDLFTPGGWETIGDLATMRFERNNMTVWLSPTIPYPVQLSMAGFHGKVVLRLTSLERGGVPLPVEDRLRDGVGLEWAAAKPWGPDDAGSGVPFPLSEAFERARDDLAWPDLRNYLAAHPNAYTARAGLEVTERESKDATERRQVERTWRMELTDGPSCLPFAVTQVVRESILPPPLGSPETTYQVEREGHYGPLEPRPPDEPCKYPYPSQGPASWPTVASANAFWAAFAAPAEVEQGPDGWSFALPPANETSPHTAMAFGQAAAMVAYEENTFSSASTAFGGRAYLALSDGNVTGFWRASGEFHADETIAGTGHDTPRGGPVGSEQTLTARPQGSFVHELLPSSGAAAAGIGAGALGAGFAYLFWPALKGLMWAGRTRTATVDHPRRRAILQRIEAQPGIHYHDLLRSTGLAKGSLEHHLRALEMSGVVRAVRTARHTCYFLARTPRDQMAALPALKAQGAREVLQAIRAHPGASGVEVARATGLGPSTVSEHVARLVSAGLVESSREGRTVRLTPTPRAARAVG